MTDIGKCGGFYPVIESIVQKHGLTTAMVFGVVWRACQGDKGVCYMSNESIGNACGKDDRTAQRHLDVLVTDGYLTERATGRTKRYYDTGKAGLAIVAIETTPDKTSGLVGQNVRSEQTKSPTIKELSKESNITTIPSGCSIDTPGEAYLFGKLSEIKKSKGWKKVEAWQNPIQREQFRAAEETLGKDGLRNAIDRALRGNITALPRIVGYVVKMADVKKATPQNNGGERYE
jgi:hypothetical protein